LEWFCRRVWPLVRAARPAATFTVYGFQPTPAVRAFSGRDGITLVPDLPDLREEVARHQVVVLPFISGGGIKNKLLEAAGMGKPILCTPHACGGLRAEDSLPLVRARSRAGWVRHLLALWSDPAERRRLGEQARLWVLRRHTWVAAARIAAGSLEGPGGACRRP
jgi:glycosyltransferase involved in cell wall biosynthesis